jgi:hypothetical protein
VTFVTRQHSNDGFLADGFEGTVPVLARGSSRQARRFEMVQQVDVVVTIGGARSIPTMITLAEALGLPVLPLPFTGGASGDAWEAMKREWRPDGEATAAAGVRREEARIAGWDLDDDLADLAASIVEVIDAVGRRGCFVAMPYDDGSVARYERVVADAVSASGLDRVLARDSLATGIVVAEMKRQIESCVVMLAVLSDERRSGSPACSSPGEAGMAAINPNVMYEVGYAHALGIPTVLLADVSVGLPFDVSGYRAVIDDRDPSALNSADHDALVAELAIRLRHAVQHRT